MTRMQRVKETGFGILQILAALSLLLAPKDTSMAVILVIVGISFTAAGIGSLWFYFTMARHMVGGKIILFQGVILLDFALFTGSLSNVPKFYILLYLIVIHAFSGVIETLRAMESRKTVEGPWRLKLGHGIVNFLLALSCLVFIRQTHTALIIYCVGLVYSALIRIISAFRRTTYILIK